MTIDFIFYIGLAAFGLSGAILLWQTIFEKKLEGGRYDDCDE